MDRDLKDRLKLEGYWLGAILLAAAAVEYLLLLILEVDPLLSIKIQGFIALMVMGYIIRIAARVISDYGDQIIPDDNGMNDLE